MIETKMEFHADHVPAERGLTAEEAFRERWDGSEKTSEISNLVESCQSLPAGAKWREDISGLFGPFDPELERDTRSPLRVAVDNEWVDCVRRLLPGSDLSERDEKGQTALIAAVRKRNQELVEALLPGSDVNAKDENGHTPLLAAIETNRGGERGMVDLLIRHSKAGPGAHFAANSRTMEKLAGDNATALIFAATLRKRSALEALLPHSDASLMDEEGVSAFSEAVTAKDWKSAKMIFSVVPASTPPGFWNRPLIHLAFASPRGGEPSIHAARRSPEDWACMLEMLQEIPRRAQAAGDLGSVKRALATVLEDLPRATQAIDAVASSLAQICRWKPNPEEHALLVKNPEKFPRFLAAKEARELAAIANPAEIDHAEAETTPKTAESRRAPKAL